MFVLPHIDYREAEYEASYPGHRCSP